MYYYPNLRFEKDLWKSGVKYIAGIDEVGRGSIAGPVVAGCVVFSKKIKIDKSKIRIDDSKRLTSKRREKACVWIKKNCLTWGIGEVSALEIDGIGIVKATRKAMRMAIGKANQKLNDRIQYLLIDAYYLPYTRGIRMPIKTHRNSIKYKNISASGGRQKAIIKGDQKSTSIASASIIAKVYRDQLMMKLGKRKKYIKYGWEKNKGYVTKTHISGIAKYGITTHHRRSFILSDLKK